ncbi:MAG: phytanoyl-CoA dioxygenase family protein [Pseudomonadota bacterium]|nr:phytanoyl-CoA dioxygenase family protein [Pseudomonadota bacterium]
MRPPSLRAARHHGAVDVRAPEPGAVDVGAPAPGDATATPSPLRATVLRDGWTVAGALLSDEDIDALRAGFDAVVDDAVRTARYPSREACLRLVQLWHDPWRVSPAYAALLGHPALLALAREVLGCEDVRLLSQRLIVKPPDGRTPLPWHQDFPHSPLAEPHGALFWIALDDVDGTTGGLRYLPGTHLGAEPSIDIEAVGAVVPAGHVLVHHPLVWHAASSNRSGRWRRACLVTVADARTPSRAGAWDPAQFPLLPWAPGG